MQLTPSPYNIKRFTHHAESKTLVTDASDLNWTAGATPFDQLYDDAADVGIALYNSRTGSVTYWHYVTEVMDGDGSVDYWALAPTYESCRKHPHVQCYTMHIYND